jgi:hypothetical protein
MSAPTTSDCNQDAARAHGSSLQRIVSRRPPLPQEVKDIMKLAARYEYDLLAKAGWCKNCKREKTDGSRLCLDCKELARVAAEKVNRKNGHKSWEAKRAEKSANDQAQRPDV